MIKKVKAKTFEQGELVWKLILPIGTNSLKFGKWSPMWEGPFRVNRCVPGNAYILETLKGEEYSRALNGKYLKKYYPSVWVDAQPINYVVSWIVMADMTCIALSAKIYTIQTIQIQVRIGFLQCQLEDCNGNWQEKGILH